MKTRLLVYVVCGLLAAAVPFAFAEGAAGSSAVTIKYIGHSCIQLTAADGTTIIADPYGFTRPSGLEMVPKGLAVDAVFITHMHSDHSGGVARLGGKKELISKPGLYKVGPLTVTGYVSDHGLDKGVSTGPNTVFVFETTGIKIVHLGAAGLISQSDILKAIRGADVAVLDVGGDAAHPLKEMVAQIKDLGVHTIVPGHYSLRSDTRFFGSPTLDEFISLAVPKDMLINRVESTIEVRPGMPDQLLIMAPSQAMK